MVPSVLWSAVKLLKAATFCSPVGHARTVPKRAVRRERWKKIDFMAKVDWASSRMLCELKNRP